MRTLVAAGVLGLPVLLTGCSKPAEENRLPAVSALTVPGLVRAEGLGVQEARVTAPILRLSGSGFRLVDEDRTQHLYGLWRFPISDQPMEYTVRMVVDRKGTPSALLRLDALSDRLLAQADCNFDPETGVSATRGEVLDADTMVRVGETTTELVCTAASVPGAQLLDVVILPAVGESVTAYSEVGTGMLDIRSISVTVAALRTRAISPPDTATPTGQP